VVCVGGWGQCAGGSTQAVGLVDDAESSDQETPPQQQQQQLLLDTQADTAALARVPAALHETFESLYMRRCDFAATGDLGYRGVRGAVGLGYRVNV
jgi:hypothetical protein